MTPELRFFVFASLGLAYFASQLLFGGVAGAMQAREWRKADRLGPLRTLERFLLMLDFGIAPLSLVLVVALLAIVVWLLVLELAPGMTLAASCAAAVFLLAAYRGLEAFCAWRTSRFEQRLADAIDIMAGALSAGANPRKALEAVVRWTEGPARREFAEIVGRLEVGLDIEQALGRIEKVHDSESVRLFCQALRAKWHVGADLGEMLTAANRTIHERIRMRIQAEGQLAGVRHAALFVAFMPHLLYAFFLIFQPQWLAAIHDAPAGGPLIYAALVLQLLGFCWLARTLRIER